MSNRKIGDPHNVTRAGYVIPHEPTFEDAEPTIVTMPTARPSTAEVPDAVLPEAQAPYAPATGAQAAAQPKPLQAIEVEYIQETDLNAVKDSTWSMFEIWTRNRVYHVDSTFKCIAVVNRASGRAEDGHSLLGTRLTGGERRSKSTSAVEIYFPLPMPGTEAVFRNDSKRHGQYGHTSTIERVVLRLRKVRVGSANAATPSWDELTGRFQPR